VVCTGGSTVPKTFGASLLSDHGDCYEDVSVSQLCTGHTFPAKLITLYAAGDHRHELLQWWPRPAGLGRMERLLSTLNAETSLLQLEG
jgi:hypothetical protein